MFDRRMRSTVGSQPPNRLGAAPDPVEPLLLVELVPVGEELLPAPPNSDASPPAAELPTLIASAVTMPLDPVAPVMVTVSPGFIALT